MKKVILIFLPKKILFHKKWSNVPSEQFFAVTSENTAFSKKNIQHKNIQHLIFDKEGYIHF